MYGVGRWMWPMFLRRYFPITFKIIGSATVDRADERGAKFIVRIEIKKRIPRLIPIERVTAFLNGAEYGLQEPWVQPPPDEELEQRVGFGFADSRRTYHGLNLKVLMEHRGRHTERYCQIVDTKGT